MSAGWRFNQLLKSLPKTHNHYCPKRKNTKSISYREFFYTALWSLGYIHSIQGQVEIIPFPIECMYPSDQSYYRVLTKVKDSTLITPITFLLHISWLNVFMRWVAQQDDFHFSKCALVASGMGGRRRWTLIVSLLHLHLWHHGVAPCTKEEHPIVVKAKRNQGSKWMQWPLAVRMYTHTRTGHRKEQICSNFI